MTSALDGSDRRRLTKSDNIRVLHLSPVWSLDGTRIVFLSNRVVAESSEAGRRRHSARVDGPSDSRVVSRCPR